MPGFGMLMIVSSFGLMIRILLTRKVYISVAFLLFNEEITERIENFLRKHKAKPVFKSFLTISPLFLYVKDR